MVTGGDNRGYSNISQVTTNATAPVLIPLTAIGDIIGVDTATGKALVESVLTAGAVTPEEATVSYQWMMSDELNGEYTAIPGATGREYTPAEGDINKYIKVVATGFGNYTGEVSCEPVQVAGAINDSLGLTITEFGATTASFAWTAVVGTSSVRIEFLQEGKKWKECQVEDGTLPPYATTATVTGLSPNTQYYFRLVITIDSNLEISDTVPLLTSEDEQQFHGGSGTEEDPYLIATAQQLFNVREYLDAHFKLSSNIDLYIYSTGLGWEPIGDYDNSFNGSFDGNGYSITGLTINGSNDDCGFFGYTGTSSVIKNVKLVGVNITSEDAAGSLVGNNLGLIDNCSASGIVNGTWDSCVGGLVGFNDEDGTVKNSYFTGVVTGDDDYIGGLVGRNYGRISDSYATGEVSGNDDVGGLVGFNVGEVLNSFAKCLVIGTGYNIGGLVGDNDGPIVLSYAEGITVGTGEDLGESKYVGGLVGLNYGPISNCYSSGKVYIATEGEGVGGLVGSNNGGDAVITNTYAKTVISSLVNISAGGLIGENSNNNNPDNVSSSYWEIALSGQDSSAGGQGRNAAEMRLEDYYVGWDFTEIWDIDFDLNDGYPYLRELASNDNGPSIINAEVTEATTATIEWTAPIHADSIKLQQSQDGIRWDDCIIEGGTISPAATTAKVMYLAPDTQYYFKLVVKDGENSWYSYVLLSTDGLDPIVTIQEAARHKGYNGYNSNYGSYEVGDVLEFNFGKLVKAIPNNEAPDITDLGVWENAIKEADEKASFGEEAALYYEPESESEGEIDLVSSVFIELGVGFKLPLDGLTFSIPKELIEYSDGSAPTLDVQFSVPAIRVYNEGAVVTSLMDHGAQLAIDEGSYGNYVELASSFKISGTIEARLLEQISPSSVIKLGVWCYDENYQRLNITPDGNKVTGDFVQGVDVSLYENESGVHTWEAILTEAMRTIINTINVGSSQNYFIELSIAGSQPKNIVVGAFTIDKTPLSVTGINISKDYDIQDIYLLEVNFNKPLAQQQEANEANIKITAISSESEVATPIELEVTSVAVNESSYDPNTLFIYIKDEEGILGDLPLHSEIHISSTTTSSAISIKDYRGRELILEHTFYKHYYHNLPLGYWFPYNEPILSKSGDNFIDGVVYLYSNEAKGLLEGVVSEEGLIPNEYFKIIDYQGEEKVGAIDKVIYDNEYGEIIIRLTQQYKNDYQLFNSLMLELVADEVTNKALLKCPHGTAFRTPAEFYLNGTNRLIVGALGVYESYLDEHLGMEIGYSDQDKNSNANLVYYNQSWPLNVPYGDIKKHFIIANRIENEEEYEYYLRPTTAKIITANHIQGKNGEKDKIVFKIEPGNLRLGAVIIPLPSLTSIYGYDWTSNYRPYLPLYYIGGGKWEPEMAN